MRGGRRGSLRGRGRGLGGTRLRSLSFLGGWAVSIADGFFGWCGVVAYHLVHYGCLFEESRDNLSHCPLASLVCLEERFDVRICHLVLLGC